MPDLFLVPFKRLPGFVGREADLFALKNTLQKGAVKEQLAVGLAGMGGIGKTQLAVEYVYRHGELYPDGIFWLNASQSLAHEFARIGRAIQSLSDVGIVDLRRDQLVRLHRWLVGYFNKEELLTMCFELGIDPDEFPTKKSSMARELVTTANNRGSLNALINTVFRERPHLAKISAAKDDTHASPDELIDIAFEFLIKRPDSLVILDNLENPAVLNYSFGQNWVPANLPCQILFTTRNRRPGPYTFLDVKVLPGEVALSLLLKRAGREGVLDLAHREHKIAGQICASLGYLPLALEVASAFLAEWPEISLSDFLTRLQDEGCLTTIDEESADLAHWETIHHLAVTATLRTQWQALTDEASRLLFQVAGQLPGAEIIPMARLGLLTGITAKATPGRPSPLLRGLRRLDHASLVEDLKENQVRLHPLVHEFARRETIKGDISTFRRQCVTNLIKAYQKFQILEDNCMGRGVDALQEDLLVAFELLPNGRQIQQQVIGIPPWRRVAVRNGGDAGGDDEELKSSLQALLRLLQQEAHNVRGWLPKNNDALFAQQMVARLSTLPFTAMKKSAVSYLSEKQSPHCRMVWADKTASSAFELTLQGHQGEVYCVAIAPDGQRLISGGYDATVKIWDLRTGQAEKSLVGHRDAVTAVTVTPDGSEIISASTDGMLNVWHLETGNHIGSFIGHGTLVTAVACAPDGRVAVSTDQDGYVHVWSIHSRQATLSFRTNSTAINAVAISPDGRFAVMGQADHQLSLWRLDDGELEHTFKGHEGAIRAVAITPDGKKVISASSDQSIRIWNLETAEIRQILEDHWTTVRAVAVTPDGQRLISASEDTSIKIWDIHDGRLQHSLYGHSYFVSSVCVTPDGRHVISASEDETLKVWSLSSDPNTQVRKGGWLSDAVITPDNQQIVVSSADPDPNNNLMVWNLASGRPEYPLIYHNDEVISLALTPDGKRLVSASHDHTLIVWDMETRKRAVVYEGHDNKILAVTITPDGRFAVSGSADQTLQLWSVQTGATERVLTGHKKPITAVAVTPNGQQIISGSEDNSIKVWDISTDRIIHTLAGHKRRITAIAVSPDSRRVVSASFDATIKIWNLLSGDLERTLLGHHSIVWSVQITRDGRRLFSASYDRSLKVWDMQNGNELASISLDASLNFLALAQPDTTILTGDAIGNVYFLEYVEPGVTGQLP